jgi:hypothetical protein
LFKTEELRWGSPTATPLFEPLGLAPKGSEEQKGSGLFFGSESEPRIDDGKCLKRDLTPFVQPSMANFLVLLVLHSEKFRVNPWLVFCFLAHPELRGWSWRGGLK